MYKTLSTFLLIKVPESDAEREEGKPICLEPLYCGKIVTSYSSENLESLDHQVTERAKRLLKKGEVLVVLKPVRIYYNEEETVVTTTTKTQDL